MNLPFMSKNDLVVGIDIGSHAVKICQLKRTDQGYSALSFGSAILPEDAVDDGTLVEPEAVAEVISNLLANLKIKAKKIGFSISGYSVIVKKINLLQMDEKELEDHIMAEAEQYIPFDIDDVYLDFQSLEHRKESPDRVDVMLVAAKKDVVDDYLTMFQGLGLQPVLIDVDNFALENTYEHSHPEDRNIALVDIGASKMNINILSNGLSVIARDVELGSRQLTEQIQAALDLDFEDAEEIKLGKKGPGEFRQQIEEIFTSTCTEWVSEIVKAMDLYHASTTDSPLTKLVLSGGGSKVVGLKGLLAKESDIEVEMFNPFEKITANPKKIDPDYANRIGAEMAIATGIAIRPSVI